MSVEVPKLSEGFKSLRVPEEQIEGILEQMGITPPEGPSQIIKGQARQFERQDILPSNIPQAPAPLEKQELPQLPDLPDQFPIPTGGELELPKIEEKLPELPSGGKKLVESVPSPSRSRTGTKETTRKTGEGIDRL